MLKNELFSEWGFVRRKFSLWSHEHLADWNLNPQQMTIIRFLAHKKSSTLTDIAAGTATDPASVSRSITALAKSGWLTKTENPNDKRQQILSLTPWAEQRIGGLEHKFHEISEMFSVGLNPEETEKLLELMKKMRQAWPERKSNT